MRASACRRGRQPEEESGKIHIDVFILAFPMTRLLPRRQAGFSREKRNQSDGIGLQVSFI